MKKILLGLLVVVLVLGVLGASAYAGYRYGFRQGMIAASDGGLQFFGSGFGMRPNRMPIHNFSFNRGFDRDGFGMMQPWFGFGSFPLLRFLATLLFWGLIGWGIYMLITRSGWRLTRTTPTVTAPPPPAEENKTPDNT